MEDKNPERKHDHCNLYFRQTSIKSIFLLKHHICHVFLKIVGNFFFLQWIPSQQTIELYVDFRANETAFF